MNPAPDADVNSVGPENFKWIVDTVAELAVRKAKEHTGKPAEYRWSAFLGGGVQPGKSAPEPAPSSLKGDGATRAAKGDPEPVLDSTKPGAMLEAASKQLRKRAGKG
jgi:hypothetical protein